MKMKMQNLSAVFGSLGQATRLEIVHLLAPVSKGKTATGLPAGQIAAALGVAPSNLSFHLKDMTLRGLLIQRRKGRELIYFVNLPLLLTALGDFVTELEF